MHRFRTTGVRYIIASVFLILLAGCIPIPFFPSQKLENQVNLTPLLNLEVDSSIQNLGGVIDIEKLKAQFNFIYLNSDKSLKRLEFAKSAMTPLNQKIDVKFKINLFDSEVQAVEYFQSTCGGIGEGRLKTGVGKHNGVSYHYCIPPLEQARVGPDGVMPALAQWYYYDMVVQNGRLAFTFDERTETTDRTVINGLIQIIVDAIRTTN